MTLRAALVGAGAVGTRHLRVLSGFGDVEIVAVHDPDRPTAELAAARLGVPLADDLAGVLAARPDAVWLCVPPFAHGELELAVVAAGLPFFVEKPLGADLAGAEAVAAAVGAAGLPTATGYHWRHLDTVARARTELASRNVRLLDARWWGTTPPPAWWSQSALSGGQVVEQATHVLDVVRLLAGEVDEVLGSSATSSLPNRDVPDATAAVLRFASGAVGTVSTSCVLPAPTAAGVDVAADGLAVSLTETTLRMTARDGWTHSVEAVVDARTVVDRAFVDLLTTDDAAPGLVDVAEALRTHRLAWAIAEATRTGSTVRVAAA
jgi:myo-inositol 2-dehydrogenase / D-chiro-inositol 1-dehydrogenase